MATAAAAVPGVGMDEVEDTAARFARRLGDILPETDIHGRPSARALATFSSWARTQAVVVDFVTPRDLEKSPSLTTLGKIAP